MSEFDDPATHRVVLESLETGGRPVDRERRIVFWNEGAETSTGNLRRMHVGGIGRDSRLTASESSQTIRADAAQALDNVWRERKSSVAEAPVRHKVADRIPVRLKTVPIRRIHGSMVGAAESFEASLEHTEADRREQKLADDGYLDQSTGAPSSDSMPSPRQAYTLQILRKCRMPQSRPTEHRRNSISPRTDLL